LEFPGSVRNLTPAVEFLGERVRETKRFGDFDASTFFPEQVYCFFAFYFRSRTRDF
jgi:hypothetical protein